MNLVFSVAAERDLARLDREATGRIIKKLLWFSANFDEEVPLPLGGQWKNFYKLRVGDWRAIYEIDHKDQRIIVRVVGHRSSIYR